MSKDKLGSDLSSKVVTGDAIKSLNGLGRLSPLQPGPGADIVGNERSLNGIAAMIPVQPVTPATAQTPITPVVSDSGSSTKE